MKNKLSVKEQRILDDSFSNLENAIHCLIGNKQFSADNVFKTIHYIYEMQQGEWPTLAMGRGREGRPSLLEFLEYIAQQNQPITSWSDVEEEVTGEEEKE